MNNILITGTSAIQFEREIILNKTETFQNIIIIVGLVILICICELIYVLLPGRNSIVVEQEKPEIVVSETIPEDLTPETFLELQPEIDFVHYYSSSRYKFYEVTLKNGYEQLTQRGMRDYINILSKDLYDYIKEDVILSVVNEQNTEQIIYSSLNGKEFYYVFGTAQNIYR